MFTDKGWTGNQKDNINTGETRRLSHNPDFFFYGFSIVVVGCGLIGVFIALFLRFIKIKRLSLFILKDVKDNKIIKEINEEFRHEYEAVENQIV
jgi:L-cysteine desulfidase